MTTRATTTLPMGTVTFACGCRTHTLDANGMGPALEHCPLHAAAPDLRESLTLLVASTTAAIECGLLALDPNDESDADWGVRISQARALLARLEG